MMVFRQGNGSEMDQGSGLMGGEQSCGTLLSSHMQDVALREARETPAGKRVFELFPTIWP